MVGIGAILRDFRGDVLLVASMKENDIQDLETIETIVILCGLQLCIQLSFTQLVIEFDYQSVVKEIQSNEDSTSPLGNLMHDIKEFMSRF